jgi:hypothetical protein
VEVGHAVGPLVGRGQTVGSFPLGPVGPRGRADAERTELADRERAVWETVQDVLNAVEFGVALGVSACT